MQGPRALFDPVMIQNVEKYYVTLYQAKAVESYVLLGLYAPGKQKQDILVSPLQIFGLKASKTDKFQGLPLEGG